MIPPDPATRTTPPASPAEPAWPPGPAAPRLAAREVHVWRAPLDLPEETALRYAQTLGPEERARAAGCRLPVQRARFVAAHGALRAVLARYTGQSPAELCLGRSERGRPHLAEDPAARPAVPVLDFNLSHAGGLALIAVTRTGRVGVDLEEVRADLDHRAMADRFLGPADAALVHGLPPEAARHAFFTRWTWREAYAKAADVPVPRLLPPPAGPATGTAPTPFAGGWKLINLPLGNGYCATVAAAGSCAPPRRWTLTQEGDRRTPPTRSVRSGRGRKEPHAHA
ncbi:4'-phosphopantetheinyl transferase family protein [Kitasatospora camelliae]|uniref:4'-phosphopantetheinyl transferase superfamily protein n=1 Tax=Kitasatospora camelliae TaxID=3156397 RepID=A0AAU8K462_9ACTN